MSARIVIAVIALSAAWVIPAAAQGLPSLAEIARQAEAAKDAKPKAKKSYTNADLHGSVDVQSQSQASASTSAAGATAEKGAGKTAGTATAPEGSAASDEDKANATNGHNLPEEHWRQRADFIRGQVDKANSEIARLNIPVPGRSAALEARNANEITKYQQMKDGALKQWSVLEASARNAKVPLAWIGAAPQ